ncbi:hypothetical protein TNCV_3484351 [Trichonephila clavipes]|nr:hypothetical protein TNCV_3484351 [Trichonephila clavipes]
MQQTNKAVHFEAVGDLTTDSFIAALRRFSAHRGALHHIILTMVPILLELVENLTKYENYGFLYQLRKPSPTTYPNLP